MKKRLIALSTCLTMVLGIFSSLSPAIIVGAEELAPVVSADVIEEETVPDETVKKELVTENGEDELSKGEVSEEDATEEDASDDIIEDDEDAELLEEVEEDVEDADKAGEAKDYKVILPEAYDESDLNTKYPVLYLLPNDGVATVDEYLEAQVFENLKSDSIMDVIVVEPNFENVDNAYERIAAIVSDVDQDYKTVASASARAVLGAEVGGYLATAFTYTNGSGSFTNSPSLFGMMASINGDFVGEANQWKALGNMYSLMNSYNNSTANRFYTYMTSATEDARASVSEGANDIIYRLIDKGAAYGGFFTGYYGNADNFVFELTVKNSAYDENFVKKAAAEAVNGIGNKLMQGMVTGGLSLTPQAAYATEPDIKAAYTVSLASKYTSFRADALNKLKLTILMTDDDTKELVADPVNVEFDVKAGTYSNSENPIALPNKINNISTTVTLVGELLGKRFVIDSKPLVRIAATGSEPENQLIDLLGGWHFMATKNVTAGVLPEASEYTQWEEVYPCLGWWDSTHSKVTNMKNYVGYAWYVKDFDIPATFPEGNYIVPVGFFDETDIVFINGKRIGGYGLDYNTWKNPKDFWDTERIYSISSDDLVIGGKNTITVLTYNASGDGGWYSGHPGLYSPAAYNKLVSKPSVFADEQSKAAVLSTVKTQLDAVNAKSESAFAATVDPEFFQSGKTKEDLVKESFAAEVIDGLVTVEDNNQLVFAAGNLLYYQANRTFKYENDTKVVDINEYYKLENGKALLYGEHDRFFTQYIDSAFKAQASGSLNEVEKESFLIYLPEGYFNPENANRRYPTAYIFHQINSSSNSYAIDGVNRYMDEGIAEGLIKDTILVIPDSQPTSWWSGKWVDMVTKEVLPFVDSHYRTIDDARYRFTVGASMGGSGSYNIGLKNPNLFSGIVSFFGAINMGENPINVALAASDEYLQYYRQFFICGNRDLYKFGLPAITLDKKLRAANVPHFFEIEEGEHDSSFYLPYFKNAFGYQTEKMSMLSKEQVASVISGSVDAQVVDGALKVAYTFDVNDSVKDYANKVPASSYTSNENPELAIPVTLNVYQAGKLAYTKTVYESALAAKNITAECEIKVDDIDLDETLTVEVGAALLNDSFVAKKTIEKYVEPEKPSKPNRPIGSIVIEDNSNTANVDSNAANIVLDTTTTQIPLSTTKRTTKTAATTTANAAGNGDASETAESESADASGSAQSEQANVEDQTTVDSADSDIEANATIADEETPLGAEATFPVLPIVLICIAAFIILAATYMYLRRKDS